MVMEYEEYAAILKAGGQPATQEYTKQFFLLVEGNLLPKYSICDIIEENFMLMPKETRGEFLYMMMAPLAANKDGGKVPADLKD